MGRRSRKRQTPDWSTAMVEVRRSCQSQRSALGFGRLGAGFVLPGFVADQG